MEGAGLPGVPSEKLGLVSADAKITPLSDWAEQAGELIRVTPV